MMDLRLKAYLPNGISRGLLPAPDSFTVAAPLNDTPALSLNYGVLGPRSSLLGQPVELAVEVSGDGGATWTEPDDCRFLYLRDGRDPIKTADTWQADAPGYIWRIQKARVLDEGKAVEGRRSFNGVTPGFILATFWGEAQARGALSGMTLSGNATTDAGGAAWGTTLSRDYDLGTDYLQVLMDLATSGYLDFRMSGRTLKLYKPDTALAVDRTLGDAQVQLTPVILTEAPFRRTWEGLADFIQVAGDAGTSVAVTNAGALKPWGRWEDYITQGGVSDTGTLTAVGQRYQLITAAERSEYTQAMGLMDGGPRPLLDFMPGDYIWSRDLAGARTRYRVRQITLQKEGNTVQGNVVLNDRFLEEDIRTRRALDAITGGASAAGSTGGPTLPGADILRPAAPGAPTVNSASYLDPQGVARAQITVDWPNVTTNQDGTAITDLARYEVQMKPGDVAGAGTWRTIASTDSATSIITLSPFDGGTVWSFRTQAVDTAGNESGWSPAQAVTAAKDTTVPVKPKTPTASARLGTGQILWDGTNGVNGGAMDADFSYVEVHVSTVSGFTVAAHDPATLVGRFGGPGVLPLPGLPYNAPRYVKLVAFDTSGNMSAESGQATLTVPPLVDTDVIGQVLDGAAIKDGTLTASEKIIGKTITGELVQALAIDGDHIKGNAIDGKTITGAKLQTDAADLTGVKFDTTGIKAYGPTGDLFLNVDPAAGMAIVAGEVKARTFTVSSSDPNTPAGSSLGGVTEIASGGSVVLTGGTTPPKSAPTLDFGYGTLQHTADSFWDERSGWATADGVNFYTCRTEVDGTGKKTGDVIVERWSGGTLASSFEADFTAAEAAGSLHLTVGGGYLWLLQVPSSTTYSPTITRMSMDGATQVRANWTGSDSARRSPAVAWDSATNELVIAQSRADNGGKVRFQRYTMPASTLVAGGATVNTVSAYAYDLGAFLVGTYDFSGKRFILSATGAHIFRTYVATDGTEPSEEGWQSGLSGGKVGLAHAGGSFQSMDTTGVARTYTNEWAATVPEQTKWVVNTLTRGPAPTYETPASPAASIVLPQRSRLIATASPIVNDGGAGAPDSVRFYIGEGTTDPGRTGRYLQTPVPATGVITQVYDALDVNTANPPEANSFPGGAGSLLYAFSSGFWVNDRSDGDVGTGSFRASVQAAALAVGDVRQVAQTALGQATSTANVTLPGLTFTVESPGPDAAWLVSINADVDIRVASTNVVELLADGVPQPAQIVTTGPAGTRGTGSKEWLVSGLAAGTRTFTARTRNTAASTDARINASHTLMTVKRAR